eukprot:9341701-Lingulodinium_polyedra.AAC.1
MRTFLNGPGQPAATCVTTCARPSSNLLPSHVKTRRIGRLSLGTRCNLVIRLRNLFPHDPQGTDHLGPA